MLRNMELKSVPLSNGETLTYTETGIGEKVLVLIHGNLGSSRHWQLLIDALPKDYKIYAIDMRGFGFSTYNTPADNIKDYALDLKLFVDALGLSKFNLSGWSLGGAVCMQFAADYPQYVEKMILLASANIKGFLSYKKDANKQPILGDYITTKEEISEDLKSMTDAVANKFRPLIEKVLEVALFNVTSATESQLNEYVGVVFQQRNLLDINYALIHFNISKEHNGVEPGNGDVDKIIAPTLIIHGIEDLIVHPVVAQEIKAGLGDKAKLVIFEDCGHFPLFDKLAEVTKEYVNFIG